MLDVWDWIFFLSGVIFFISIIGIFISAARENIKLLRRIGVIVISLLIPLIIVFIDYIVIGQELMRIIYIIVILVYLIVELLLDFILKIEFREKTITHVPYIILEYAACFSFIYNTLAINRTMGWVVSIFFWAMLATLIYYIVIKKKKEKK